MDRLTDEQKKRPVKVIGNLIPRLAMTHLSSLRGAPSLCHCEAPSSFVIARSVSDEAISEEGWTVGVTTLRPQRHRGV